MISVHMFGKFSSSIEVVGCLGTIHERATDSKSLKYQIRGIMIHFNTKKYLKN